MSIIAKAKASNSLSFLFFSCSRGCLVVQVAKLDQNQTSIEPGPFKWPLLPTSAKKMMSFIFPRLCAPSFVLFTRQSGNFHVLACRRVAFTFFSFNWIAAQLYKNNNNNTRQRRVQSILKEMKDLTRDDSYQDFREKENFGY